MVARNTQTHTHTYIYIYIYIWGVPKNIYTLWSVIVFSKKTKKRMIQFHATLINFVKLMKCATVTNRFLRAMWSLLLHLIESFNFIARNLQQTIFEFMAANQIEYIQIPAEMIWEDCNSICSVLSRKVISLNTCDNSLMFSILSAPVISKAWMENYFLHLSF